MRARTRIGGAIAFGLGVMPAVAGANAIEVVAWADVGNWRIECVRADGSANVCEMFAIVTVEAEPEPREVILQFSPGEGSPGQTVAIVADELGFDVPPSAIKVDGREIVSLASVRWQNLPDRGGQRRPYRRGSRHGQSAGRDRDRRAGPGRRLSVRP